MKLTIKQKDALQTLNEEKTIEVGSANELEPVLALITHQGDLGKNEWYEVVYFFKKWQSYACSKTFEDGERVVKWKYVKDCL